MIPKCNPKQPDFMHHIENICFTCYRRIPESECHISIYCPWNGKFETIIETYEIEGEPDYIRVCLSSDIDHCYTFHKSQVTLRHNFPFKHCGSNET